MHPSIILSKHQDLIKTERGFDPQDLVAKRLRPIVEEPKPYACNIPRQRLIIATKYTLRDYAVSFRYGLAKSYQTF